MVAGPQRYMKLMCHRFTDSQRTIVCVYVYVYVYVYVCVCMCVQVVVMFVSWMN